MTVIFEQVLILFIFVSIGYALGKGQIAKTDHAQILSGILVNVFLPCNIFKTFSSRFTLAYIRSSYEILLASIGILSVLVSVAHIAAKLFSKETYERYVYQYSLAVPNYGYMGYALAEALLKETGLTNMMTFALPVSLYVYTIGFASLTKRGLNLKKLCNPIMIATVSGIAAGLCGISTPEILTSVLQKASGCMAPVSMLLTGIMISELSVKKIICNPRLYLLTALRLVVIPLLLGSVLSAFCKLPTVQTAVLFYALPCGLNTVVFPKLINKNCEIGAGLALISTVFACVTLPVVLGIFI